MKTSTIFLPGLILMLSVQLLSRGNNEYSPESNFRFYCPSPPFFTQLLNHQNEDSPNGRIPDEWKETLIEKIISEEYNISFDEKLNAYQSPNRANNIRFIYHKDGFTAKTRSTRTPLNSAEPPVRSVADMNCKVTGEWMLDLRVSGLKRTSAGSAGLSVSMDDAEIMAEGNRANIENENLRIDYVNNDDGMRQDFIVKNKPAGEGNLKLELTVQTDLKVIVGADALVFKNKAEEEKMRYSALKCWDSQGKELRAYFSLSPDSPHSKYGSELVNIIVNDENAVYPVTIDPLSSSYSWINGPQFDSRFGYSVSTAGDVNGDGYSDVIVGAFLYDNGLADEGLAQVFYGSATGLSATAAWSKEGNNLSASFGWSVSTAGDVNGDGYSDVIVGARFYNSRQGAAFVYHGSASGLPATANWTRLGYTINTYFAHCVSTAGDVNGDGYSDVIVSAIYDGNLPSLDGRVFLYKGSSSGLSTTASQTLTGPHHNDLFGNTISLAGDVNGDGLSDIIVGAPHFTNSESIEGKAYVFKGENTAAGLNATPAWEVESNIASTRFGSSVAGAGDVNGDGYSDIVVGSSTYSNGQSNEGRVQLFYGNSSGGSTTAAWSYESNYAGAKLGSSVQTAGDVNGDGYADIIAGAPEYSNNQTEEGRAYVFFGSSSGPGAGYDWTYEDNSANAWLGYSVCTAGDINGDGFSDVIIGVPIPIVGIGAAFIFEGYAAGLASAADWTEDNNQESSQLGYSVAIAGDVNGDGYSDVIVGAPFFDNGQTDEGRAYVYYGSLSGLSASPDWNKEGGEDSAQFGSVVGTAGDINGDGYSDVIVTAPYFDGSGYVDQGRVWIYNGSSSGISTSASWNKNIQQNNARFGSSASTAGDVNGDGYSDIIVGSNLYDNGETDEGKVFVYYGSSSGLSSYPVWTAESNQAGAQFGNDVAIAGDVNGDGYSDVIVGAQEYSSGESNEGCAFVYYGSASGLPSTWNALLESNQADANFGISVSTAGDVNGDSFTDVIVGANLFDNGEDNEGAAFVYHGSSSGMNSTPARILELNQAAAHVGKKVSNAGDVNGDGYSDILVAAPDYDNGQNNEGVVKLYYGSPTGIPSSPVWTSEADQSNAEYGGGLSTAGDVNGDGYSDIIIGSPLYNNGETDEGLIYVFYGNEGICKRINTTQFQNGSNTVVCSGNLTGQDGTVKLQMYSNSPFGRADGRLVHERKREGVPFSGTVITNSTESSDNTSFTDLSFGGKNISTNLTGLNASREFKWRARVQYRLTNNPYQKLGPWKYFTNYIPVPYGDFKPKAPQLMRDLTVKIYMQGFYNGSSNQMVSDTVSVSIRQSVSPFNTVATAKFYLNTSGTNTQQFDGSTVLNGAPYYLQLTHRNSIETWSSSPVSFVNGNLYYDFTTSASQAYGNNMISVDGSPVAFAVFGGDVNQDGTVDATDVSMIDNDASNFVTGYVVTDLTGDDFVDGTDFVIADNNAANFVSVIRP